MKKLIYAVAILLTMAISIDSSAQAGGITKYGKYVNYKFPDSIATSKTVVFPTATTLAPSYTSDSINVKVGEFYTILTVPQLTAQRRVKLTNQSYLTGGAQLVIDATADGTARNLIVIHSAGSDTLSVTSKRRGTWTYTGSKWLPSGQW
jgi:hypothetical protein